MLAKQSQTISQVKRRLMQKSKGLNGGGCLNARMCTCIFCIPTALINKHVFLCKTTGQTSFQQVPYPMARPGEELLLVLWVFFLVKDDPCGMYRSDKGTRVGSLRPFYSPLSEMHRFALLSLKSAFGPMGSSVQIFVEKAWWDWEIMPAPAPLLIENTELLRAVYVNMLFPQKRTVALLTNWVTSHLAWSK